MDKAAHGALSRALDSAAWGKLKAGEALRAALARVGVYRASGHEHLSGSLVVPGDGPVRKTVRLPILAGLALTRIEC